MDVKQVINELGRIKHNCNCMTDAECMNGFCPYYGKKEILKTGYKFQCYWEEIGMGIPCDWEIPEEIGV